MVEPLEESGQQLVLVTEAIAGSLANYLTDFRDVPPLPLGGDTAAAAQQGGPAGTAAGGSSGGSAAAVPLPAVAFDRGTPLSPLEVKHGLVSLADTLHFLATEAHVAVCSLGPATVLLAADGAFKLGCFAHALPCDYAAPAADVQLHSYADSHPPLGEALARPDLAFLAPELVAGLAGPRQPVTPAADIWSLAALAVELLTSSRLLPGSDRFHDWQARLGRLDPGPSCPAALAPVLRAALSAQPSSRPPAAAFSGAAHFQDDMQLKVRRTLCAGPWLRIGAGASLGHTQLPLQLS